MERKNNTLRNRWQTRTSFPRFNQTSHRLQQTIRQQRFHPKCHIQSLVLLFRFFQPADHQHRQPRMCLAQSPNELRTAHPWHQMIGNHQIDLGRELATLKLFQRPRRVQRSDHKIPGTSQNCLPCRRLYSVIVNKKKIDCHARGVLQGKKYNRVHIHSRPFLSPSPFFAAGEAICSLIPSAMHNFWFALASYGNSFGANRNPFAAQSPTSASYMFVYQAISMPQLPLTALSIWTASIERYTVSPSIITI